MPRTTATAIKEILDTTLSTAQINAFIADANLWVTEELTSAALSAERMEIIERYLACALTKLRELGLKSSTIGDVSESYQTDADVTDYLLRAASFDSSGKVRQHFLAPKPVAQAQPIIIPAIMNVGKGFAEDV